MSLRRLIVAEPMARTAIWSRRLAVFALAIAAVAIALSRLHQAEPPAVLTVFGAALVLAALAALLGITAAIVIWRDGLRGAEQAALGFALAAALLAYPVYLSVLAFALPPINDVSTDLKSPPTFLLSTKALEARAGIEPPPASDEMREAQMAAYPDIATIMVGMDPTEAYQMALDVAGELGWRVVDSEPPNLNGDGSALIEATAGSFFFGFGRNIAIRIRPGATETAIDVRSVSQVGRHDFGSNARRVRRFIATVKEETGEH
jgi:uncharacterized protein (DUF1499 family)